MMKQIFIFFVLGMSLATGESVPSIEVPVKVDFSKGGVPKVESIVDKFKSNEKLQDLVEKYELPYKEEEHGRYWGSELQEVTLYQYFSNTHEPYGKDGKESKSVRELSKIVAVYVSFNAHGSRFVSQTGGKFFVFMIDARSEWIYYGNNKAKEVSNSAKAVLKCVTTELKLDELVPDK